MLRSGVASDFTYVSHPHPHVERGRRILAAHPELRALATPFPLTAAWVTGLVAAQLALALLVGHRPWYVWVPVAYVVGATIDHALWVLVHDCCHHLVFRWRTGNRLIALLANVPSVLPSAMSFWKYHMLHHRHLNELARDTDVPGPVESRLVGASTLRKALWLAGYPVLVATIRPRRLATVRFLDGWTVANVATQTAVVTALVLAVGWDPLKYLVVSALSSVGFHPLGARWIQEHYVSRPGQETNSYYGPLNRVMFNIGYHNEHHDLMTIPWSRLPRVRAAAPEFYEPLHAHRSLTRLFVTFLRDGDVTLFDRMVRADAPQRPVRNT